MCSGTAFKREFKREFKKESEKEYNRKECILKSKDYGLKKRKHALKQPRRKWNGFENCWRARDKINTKACFLDGNTLFMYNTMDYVWALSAYAVKAKLKAIARLVNKT